MKHFMALITIGQHLLMFLFYKQKLLIWNILQEIKKKKDFTQLLQLIIQKLILKEIELLFQQNIFKKLGANDRIYAVTKAIRLGLITPRLLHLPVFGDSDTL